MHPQAMRVHQVHPAKLATDLISALAALLLFWAQHLVWGTVLLLAPPFVATALVLRFGDLDRVGATRLGAAAADRMIPLWQGVRLAGMLVAVIGAWLHVPLEIGVGLLLVAAGWATTLQKTLA
ncbi:MAG: hypothetical protein QOE90_786 [Thermoplasmata archaeon]|jgi:hypothetical protein|nr:hypothetical protein [Thermoplasmata archaeon]